MNLKINWKQGLIPGIITSLMAQIIYWILSFQLNKQVEEFGSDVLMPMVSFPPDLLSIILVFIVGFIIGFILAMLINLIIIFIKNNNN